MNKIGVLGAGTWGIALARMLCIAAIRLRYGQLWSRRSTI